MDFKTTVIAQGKSILGVEVPDSVVAKLGGGKVPPIVATVNGYTWATRIGVRGGRSLFPITAAHRDACGVSGGDSIKVRIELDEQVRTVTIPADLKKALKEASATTQFNGLSYRKQKAHVVSVESAKTDATRQRRIEKVVADLQAANV